MEKNDIVEVWSQYASAAEEVTNKRQNINAVFITVQIALLGFIVSDLKILGICLSLAGLLVSITWIFMIISYKKLNSVKFEVIQELEKDMEVTPYTIEWNKLKMKKYIRLTTIEMICSGIFVVGFVITLILSILGTCGKI